MKEIINDENVYFFLLNKSQEALEYLINKYSSRMHNFIKRIINHYGANEDAEDIVSNIFVELWIGNYKFEKERSNISTWLFTISRYEALDLLRKNKKNLNTISWMEYNEVPDESFEEQIIIEEYIEKIINLADEFSEIDKRIFLLRYFYYQNTNKISKFFNLSRSNVDVKLHRCRKILKEKLERWEKYGKNQ